MKELQKIKQKIIDQARFVKEKELERAKPETDQYVERAKKRIDDQLKEQKRLAEINSIHVLNQQKERAEHVYRQRLSVFKNQTVNQIYDDALKVMEQWTEPSLLRFLTDILKNFKSSSQTYELVIGEKTYTKLSRVAIDDLLAQYPSVTFNASLLANDSGFIVRQGKIDYNFTFQALIDDLKKDFTPDLSRLIFDELEE